MECGDEIAAFGEHGVRESLTGPAPTQRKLSHPKPRRSAASQSGDSVTALHIAHVRLHAKREDCPLSPGSLRPVDEAVRLSVNDDVCATPEDLIAPFQP